MAQTERYITGEIVQIDAQFLTILGTPEPGGDGQVTIRRKSDDRFFDGAAWVVPETKLAMTAISAPGWWRYSFDTTGLAEDEYIGQIFDDNGVAANVPQVTEIIVGGWPELVSAGAVGRAKYDPVTSVLTLFAANDPGTIIASFDMKNVNGDPAGFSPHFEKVPQ